MDFSVVVPVYNKEKTIQLCINSLLNQDYPRDKYEVIFVDNNSSDNSCSIISRYPSIQLIHEKEQRVYAARNSGILKSKGDVVVFTDADTEVKREWLENTYLSLSKNNYDILIGWYSPAVPIKLLEIHGLLISKRIKMAVARKNASMITACAANLAIKRELFAKEGLFLTNSNSEDMYFVVRCLEKGYNIGFSDTIEVKRNDIGSISIFLVKNFIYGCSNILDIKPRLPLLGKLRYVFLTIEFVFKYFPIGLGLLMCTFFYFAGYLLSKSGILTPLALKRLIHNYTNFVNRRGL